MVGNSGSTVERLEPVTAIAIHRGYELRPHELAFIRLLAPSLDDKAFEALSVRRQRV